VERCIHHSKPVKMRKGKYASKIKTVIIWVGKILSVDWIYRTDEEYFVLNFFWK
jgi:hypothetical protein